MEIVRILLRIETTPIYADIRIFLEEE